MRVRGAARLVRGRVRVRVRVRVRGGAARLVGIEGGGALGDGGTGEGCGHVRYALVRVRG